MKAIVMTAAGGPEVLALRDVPVAEPGLGQVRVKVHAAGVNPIDYKVRRAGLFGAGPGTILGWDVAGTIDAIGPGVSGWKPGDAVFYSPEFGLPGAYAETNVVRADLPVALPAGLSFEEAAGIPLAGMTAWDGIVTRGDLRVGQTVVIHAAAGGVGSLAVQIAKAAGAYVFATCSTRSVAFVQGLGADRVIDYTREDFAAVVQAETRGAGVELVFDGVGGDVVVRSVPIMKPMGRIVTIVNPTGDLAVGYRKNITLHYEFLQRKRETLALLATLLERRQLRPLVDRVLPLEQAAEAHRTLETGGTRGKIVLKVV